MAITIKNLNNLTNKLNKLDNLKAKKAVEEVKRLTGRTSFPVFVINGKVIQGFKQEEVEEALADEK